MKVFFFEKAEKALYLLRGYLGGCKGKAKRGKESCSFLGGEGEIIIKPAAEAGNNLLLKG